MSTASRAVGPSARRSGPAAGRVARRLVAALIPLVAWLGFAPAASAHPYYLRSVPAAGSVSYASPAQMDIFYTEDLDRPYTSVLLIGPRGQRVGTHPVGNPAGNEISVAPEQRLATGTWAVRWTAVGDDGHTVLGAFGVSVGQASTNPALGGASGGTPTLAGASPGVSGPDAVLGDLLTVASVLLAAFLAGARLIDRSGSSPTRRRAEWVTLVIYGLAVLALNHRLLAPGGPSAFFGSQIGRVLVAQVALAAAAAAFLARRSGPGRPSPLRGGIGVVLGAGVAWATAARSHAAPRQLHVVVYSVHLLAVAVWVAALLLLALSEDGRVRVEVARRSSGAVAASVGVIGVTGVLLTGWGLRAAGQLADTGYGLLISTKVVLLVVAVVLGAWALLRRPRAAGVGLIEGGVVAAAMVIAGLLGQLPRPVDVPPAAQAYADQSGLPVSVALAGDDHVVGALAPGVVGRNRILAQLARADGNDFSHPIGNVTAMSARLTCGGCGSADQTIVLRRQGDGPWWAAYVDLGSATTWTVIVDTTTGATRRPQAILTAAVQRRSVPDQVVIGVAGDLSSPFGQDCQNEVMGIQTALADADTKAFDHGRLVRVLAVDTTAAPGPALDRLNQLHPRVVVPCGSPSTVAVTVARARAWHVPLVAGSLPGSTPDGVWSVNPDWTAEGRSIAAQAAVQGAGSVTVLAGDSAIDRLEVAGLAAGLRAQGIAFQVRPFGDAEAGAASVAQPTGPRGLVTLIGSPAEALPAVAALSGYAARTGWVPARGILASAQLMDTDFINGAGQLARVGAIEFASAVDPFDPLSQYYAARLRQLVPGIRPTFSGVSGFDLGWLVTRALAFGGGDPSPARLAAVLGSRFRAFQAGSLQGSWGPAGGGVTQIAFFRSTYVDPMVMPAQAPGGAASLAHEGTFLDTGGFEQITPFRRLD